MTTPSNTHPAAVEVRGRMCLENERGGFDPLTQIAPAELLEDELVRKLLAYAKPLSAELARFKSYSFADVEAFLGLLAQEYNVEKRTRKGNLTLYTYDRRLKVEIKSSDRIVFGPQLQMAKAKIDQCLLNWGASADPRLQTIVNSAFDVDREGNVRPARILLLRRAHITDDPEWTDAMRAIDDAMRVVGTSFYMLFRQRVGDTDHWERISLDFANVELTPDAEAAYSPRRELEQAQAQIGEIAAQLARLEPVCDTDGDLVAAVKWAADYIAEDLADHTGLKAVLARVQGLPEGITVAGAVEWLVDSIGGLHGWLEGAAEDGEHIAASQVLLSLPEIAPRKPNTAAAPSGE